MLFFLGNGCSKHLITEWILTSQHWTTLQKRIKRTRQIDFINNNLDSKANIWFYYDVHHSTWLFLNGEFRNTNNLWKPYLVKNDKCCIFFSFFLFFSLSLSITKGYSVFHILFVILTTMFHCIKSFKLTILALSQWRIRFT